MFFRIESKARISEVFFGVPTEVDGKIKKLDGTLDFMAKYGFYPIGKDEGGHNIIKMEDWDYWKDVQMAYDRVKIYYDLLNDEKKAEYDAYEKEKLAGVTDYNVLLEIYEDLSEKAKNLRA